MHTQKIDGKTFSFQKIMMVKLLFLLYINVGVCMCVWVLLKQQQQYKINLK